MVKWGLRKMGEQRMVINNFDKLKSWMKFEPGTYYKFVALVRAKDFKDGKYRPVLNVNERGEIFVRQWFVDSEEALEKYKDDMINLCIATRARLYVTTDRKSVTKTILSMQEQLQGYVSQLLNNPNAPISIRKLSKFSASASQLALCSDGPKYWLIDVDNTDITNEEMEQIVKDFDFVMGNYFPIKMKTPNGYHLLFPRTFGFRDEFAKLWKQAKDKTFSVDEFTYNMCEKTEQAFERLWKYRDNWEDKDNALTLVFMDFADIVVM